jgi:hypothetical protein
LLTLAFHFLAPAELLLLNLVLIVDSSKQSSVQPRVRKLLSEVLASIIQGEPGLLLESQFAGQPFDFVLLQKADSKSLARLLILRQAQLLDQR